MNVRFPTLSINFRIRDSVLNYYFHSMKSQNISSQTVDYRIQQALKQLRKELKDYLPLLLFFFAPK